MTTLTTALAAFLMAGLITPSPVGHPAPMPGGHHFSGAESASSGAGRASNQASAKTDVYVVGTLYRRHDTIPAYDVATVRRIVLAIKPDVLVVDCTPQEVRDRRVHESKIEYARVIFPLMQEQSYKVYPAEPDEPLFTEIVQTGTDARQTFQRTKPQEYAALQDYVKATYTALAVHWRTPADVQDTLTGQVLAAKVALDGRLNGTADLSTRWNQHWTDAILRAVRENPGQRVLALTGIENRAWILNALAQAPEVELIDLPSWMRSNLQ